MDKYNHEEIVHNLDAPREIVPKLIELICPKSVLDVGCGIGTFLYVFKENGVKEVLGIDGTWVDKEKLYKYVEPNEFQEKDLEKSFLLERKFDLVISLEVAEHISESSADVFVQNLINAGEIILFSASVPYQGGQNHINEQWLTYWQSKFLKYDYVLCDILRPIFWDNQNVNWWYKQNMVLFIPKENSLIFNAVKNPILNIIHYDLFIKKEQTLQKVKNEIMLLRSGKAGKKFYFKALIKSFFNKN